MCVQFPAVATELLEELAMLDEELFTLLNELLDTELDKADELLVPVLPTMP